MRGEPCGISFIKSKNKRADKQHGVVQSQEPKGLSPGQTRIALLPLAVVGRPDPDPASTHDVAGALATPAPRLAPPSYLISAVSVGRISFILVSHFFARPAYLMVYPPLCHSTAAAPAM